MLNTFNENTVKDLKMDKKKNCVHCDEETENLAALKVISNYWTFRKTYKFLQKSQWWSREEIQSYQQKQLKKLLDQSYKNVPYYSKIFDKNKIKPRDVESYEDLQKIPFLTKKIIRENFNDLRSKNYNEGKFELAVTGGSTGVALEFFVEKGITFAKNMAFVKTMIERGGCNLIDKSVCLTSDDIAWRYQLFHRKLALSSFFMHDKHLEMYVKKIQKFKPKYIYAYPSSITLLAIYMKKRNLEINQCLKTIFCSGETFHDWQKNLLKETFKCKIYEWYGLRECTALAETCEHSDFYHFFPQYGIVELIGKDGKQIDKEGEIGEIVTTGFLNFVFPFVRYKTGDIGMFTKKKCICGREYPLLKKIIGRTSEFLVSVSGDLIPFTGFCGVVPESSPNVKELQFYQEKEGEVILYIVKDKKFTINDEQAIKKNLKKRFGNEINLIVRYVDTVSKTKMGKHQFLIQKLPIKIFS